MKYKLISNNTNQEHICDKVTIDVFDYYVSDYFLRINDYGYWEDAAIISQINDLTAVLPETKKVIATNNPSIDVPKVVSEVGKAWEDVANSYNHRNLGVNPHAFELGYHESQETHPFSEEDMIEFLNWVGEDDYKFEKWATNKISPKELLQLWKEQQPKIVYYE